MAIDAAILHSQLVAAGIPITGCSSAGIVQFAPEATRQQMAQADAIVAAYDENAVNAAKVAADAARQADLAPLRQVQSMLDEIDTDLASTPANLTQAMLVVKRMLQREHKLLIGIQRMANQL